MRLMKAGTFKFLSTTISVRVIIFFPTATVVSLFDCGKLLKQQSNKMIKNENGFIVV